jgi:hypothetical protein
MRKMLVWSAARGGADSLDENVFRGQTSFEAAPHAHGCIPQRNHREHVMEFSSSWA